MRQVAPAPDQDGQAFVQNFACETPYTLMSQNANTRNCDQYNQTLSGRCCVLLQKHQIRPELLFASAIAQPLGEWQ